MWNRLRLLGGVISIPHSRMQTEARCIDNSTEGVGSLASLVVGGQRVDERLSQRDFRLPGWDISNHRGVEYVLPDKSPTAHSFKRQVKSARLVATPPPRHASKLYGVLGPNHSRIRTHAVSRDFGLKNTLVMPHTSRSIWFFVASNAFRAHPGSGRESANDTPLSETTSRTVSGLS